MKFAKYIFIIAFITFTGITYAQKSYPQNYFLFPIKPGQRSFLAGTMGELRPNHFHGGLDIKTGNIIRKLDLHGDYITTTISNVINGIGHKPILRPLSDLTEIQLKYLYFEVIATDNDMYGSLNDFFNYTSDVPHQSIFIFYLGGKASEKRSLLECK